MEIIDFHVHLGEDADGERLSVEDLLESMRRNRITKSVVFPFSSKDMVKDSIKIRDINHERLIPFLRFNPKTIKKAELETLLESGFMGVKLHPFSQKFLADDQALDWVYQTIQDRNMPLLLHSASHDDFSKTERIINLAKRFPRLKIIIAHFFGNNPRILPQLKGLENIYVDISVTSPTLRIRQLMDNGFKNLVFASDFPYDSQAVAVLKVKETGLSKKDMEKIFSENAKYLLNRSQTAGWYPSYASSLQQ